MRKNRILIRLHIDLIYRSLSSSQNFPATTSDNCCCFRWLELVVLFSASTQQQHENGQYDYFTIHLLQWLKYSSYCCLPFIEQERVLARAEELLANGVEPDYDVIFVELFGKVKKRKQIPGAGQATSLYFPFAVGSTATSASVGSAGLSNDQIDELLE
ncbi:hypothetical protein AAHA92_00039 [Salvia divinorum]|uniref:Uncharacterized protein n=1 Tax=Salvia divinorum TaxID=28513 RepID=A0ABD1IMG4_SALDI